MTPSSTSPVPRQSTIPVQIAATTATTGERTALICRALSAESTVAWLTAERFSSSLSCRP
jgi:hypothetical protein